MLPPNDDPLELFARSRARAHQFGHWLETLRAGDPAFAEASVLYPDDMGEWQAGVYLLTGCHEPWRALGERVLSAVSLGPVIAELEQPRRPWSGSEHAILRWAAHFWDVDRWPAQFPYVFDEFYFGRWIRACHLYKRLPPVATTDTGSAP